MSSSRGLGGGGGGGAGAAATRDLVSEREGFQREVDEVLGVSRAVADMYGNDAVINQFQVATMKGSEKNSVIGYYDGGNNIAINENYFNSSKLNDAYDQCVKSGFHPSRGNKTGLEAVTAHEYGHALTAYAAKKMGAGSLVAAAAKIVKESKGAAGHKNVYDLASKISGYAKHSYAETIAEAFSDVFCNGSKAKKESRAVVDTMNKYIKT